MKKLLFTALLIATPFVQGCREQVLRFHNDASPQNFSYFPSEYTFRKGTANASSIPRYDGRPVKAFAISPSLPQGLSFNTENGMISGTAQVISSRSDYVISATTVTGKTSATLVNLTVIDIAPSNVQYDSALYTLEQNTAATIAAPTSDGGPVVSYEIAPSLPSGLSLDPSTGGITGTPLSISASAQYRVTAKNSGGESSVVFQLEVIAQIVQINSYSEDPANYSLNSPITPNVPTTSGGVPVSYSISPSLAGTGLSFSTTTGIISGTPTSFLCGTTYSIRATNQTGQMGPAFDLVLEIADPPVGLAYGNSSPTYIDQTPISPNTVSFSGSSVGISFAVSPDLTAQTGLTFNTATGQISGTPNIFNAGPIVGTYTVTATNCASGEDSETIMIRVNPQSGAVDTSFGGGDGVYPIADLFDVRSNVAANSTGEILFGGTFTTGPTGRPFSALVNEIGTTTEVAIAYGNFGEIRCIRVLQDDSVILVGNDNTDETFVIKRTADLLNPVLAFGTSGETRIDSASISSSSCEVDSQGRIVFGGYLEVATTNQGFLGRLLSDGSFDTDSDLNLTSNFGTNGIIYRPSDDPTEVLDLVIQPDDKIVASFRDDISPDFISRYSETGALDTAFGTSGSVLTDAIRSLLIFGSDFILSAGTFNLTPDLGISSFTGSGAVTSSTITLGGVGDQVEIYDTAIDSQGRVIYAGYLESGPDSSPILFRQLTNGAIDSRFNPAVEGEVRAVTVQEDGMIIVITQARPATTLSDGNHTHIYRFWP